MGVEVDLNREYGSQYPESANRLAAYEKDVRKLINEGTAPTLEVKFFWHEIALRSILEVRVPVSQARVHLIENGEIYRRSGGTNRKWRPVEAMAGEPQNGDSFGH